MVRLAIGLLGLAGAAVAAALLLTGGTLWWVSVGMADEQGFIHSEPGLVDVAGYAVITGPAQIDLSEELPLRYGELATLRVQAEAVERGTEIFVGIAPPTAMDAYLTGVEHAELTGIAFEPLVATYSLHPGQTAPRLPTSESFWEAAAYGEGAQTLSWELEAGSYALALMNADGSPGVRAQVTVGGRVPLLRPTGVAMLIGGSVLVSLSSILLALALAL